MVGRLSLRISGFDSPAEVVPLFVRGTVIVPTSYGKKTSGFLLKFDTATSENASVELVSVVPCTKDDGEY